MTMKMAMTMIKEDPDHEYNPDHDHDLSHNDLLSLDLGQEDLLGDAGIHGFGQLEVDPKLDHNHHHDP